MPSARDRDAGRRAIRRYDELERVARASLRRLEAHDRGDRKVDPEKLRAARAQRRDDGLPYSQAALRAVLLDPRDMASEFGYPLSLDEFRLLAYRNGFTEHGAGAVAYAKRCLRAFYGGVYLEGDRRGQHLAIALTRGAARHRPALIRRMTMGGRFLRVHTVEFTFAELERVQDRIHDGTKGDGDILTTSTDPVRNRVAVELYPYAPERAAELRQRFGPAVHVVRGTGPIEPLG